MLEWYKYLYVGNNAKKHIKKYKKYLEKGRTIKELYLITLASNQTDQLDIVHCYFLLQQSMRQRCPMIVGVAKGRDEAQELFIEMIKETVQCTGNANVKEYLLQR